MLKENWFRIGFLCPLVLIAISTAYYFVYFLPIQTKQQQVHKLTIECMNIGEKIALQRRSISEQNPAAGYYFQYHYNPRLNECYYYEDEQLVGKTDTWDNELIMEAYTHSVIYARRCQEGSPEGRCLPGSEFNKKKCELFEEKY